LALCATAEIQEELNMEKSMHPVEVTRIHERILKESLAEGRYVDIGTGHKIYVIEAGAGPPLVYLHGGGAAAHTFLPVLEYLEGVRSIVPDRPGYGLSDPVHIGHKGYRAMALEVTHQILDALGLDQISLAGSSGGGVWAIWYALAHPERVQRLILLGSAPLLPGTRAPFPLRISTAPVIGDLMGLMPANESTVVKMMKMVGEGKTIVKYPMMVQALAASNNDPLAAKAARTEYAAFLNLLGFKTNMKIRTGDLAKLSMPTLVIWGDHDPLGGEAVARAVSEAIPNCVLEMLPAGHAPSLGHPEKSARLISDFVLSRQRTPKFKEVPHVKAKQNDRLPASG
jgi:pimeloyl-ACP methyl ester carboxylesterase